MRQRIHAVVLIFAAVFPASPGLTAESVVATPADPGPSPTATTVVEFTADGRLPLAQLATRFVTLSTEHGWRQDDVYTYPDDPTLHIRAWRTPRQGPALWVIAGIHGEEPAGPNAIARRLESLLDLARQGVPIVVIPLCNPQAYRYNWRYPNTPERDWQKGGYSVGDSGYLLPDLESGESPRESAAAGPDTRALTQYVLRMARDYPPRLVLDLHEDELSREGGYIYSQGVQADANPVGAKIVRLLQDAGIPLRTSGQTRFGERIVDGVISRDDKGGPLRDGSIDELLAAQKVFVEGKPVAGPGGTTVIVVETPAFAGSQLERRIAAHAAVVEHVADLWHRSATVREDTPH